MDKKNVRSRKQSQRWKKQNITSRNSAKTKQDLYVFSLEYVKHAKCGSKKKNRRLKIISEFLAKKSEKRKKREAVWIERKKEEELIRTGAKDTGCVKADIMEIKSVKVQGFNSKPAPVQARSTVPKDVKTIETESTDATATKKIDIDAPENKPENTKEKVSSKRPSSESKAENLTSTFSEMNSNENSADYSIETESETRFQEEALENERNWLLTKKLTKREKNHFKRGRKKKRKLRIKAKQEEQQTHKSEIKAYQRMVNDVDTRILNPNFFTPNKMQIREDFKGYIMASTARIEKYKLIKMSDLLKAIEDQEEEAFWDKRIKHDPMLDLGNFIVGIERKLDKVVDWRKRMDRCLANIAIFDKHMRARAIKDLLYRHLKFTKKRRYLGKIKRVYIPKMKNYFQTLKHTFSNFGHTRIGANDETYIRPLGLYTEDETSANRDTLTLVEFATEQKYKKLISRIEKYDYKKQIFKLFDKNIMGHFQFRGLIFGIILHFGGKFRFHLVHINVESEKRYFEKFEVLARDFITLKSINHLYYDIFFEAGLIVTYDFGERKIRCHAFDFDLSDNYFVCQQDAFEIPIKDTLAVYTIMCKGFKKL